MANGRSYTSYFKADSSGFKKGVDDMVKALEKANKELVNNQYRQKDCNKVISDAQKEIKKLEKEQKENGSLSEEQTKKLKALNDTIESEKVKLAQLKTEQAAIKGTISDLSKEIAGNNKEWTTLKATIANLASDGLEALGRKLLEIGKSVIATGEQFTASMSEVGAISGATAEEMELLEQTAREYGATTKFSASESAQALKYMALAGWDTQQSIESLGSVLDLAAAGNMDLARASDIVTDYITAFGLSAQDSSHFVDVMAYAMSNSNTNVEQLGEAYKNCAAGAGAMGYSVEDVTAALMTMANAGIKGGEAGTSLNAVMTRLATDTKGCATALEEYGVYIYDSEGNMKSMSSILESLAQTWQGLTQEEQANLGKMIAGQNQLNAFQTMMAGLSDKAKEAGASFSDYTKALEECDGTSEGMAKTMSDNLSGDLKTMQSAFEELALKIYDSGETPLRDLVQFITEKGVPALEKLIDSMDVLLPVFIAAGTAIGSYKATLGVLSLIKTINETAALATAKAAEKVATDEATASQAALNGVQAANPIGLLVGLISSLVAGLTAFTSIAHTATENSKELNSAFDAASSAFASATAGAEAEAKYIETLGEEYEKLTSKSILTKEEKEKLASIAETLQTKLGLEASEVKNAAGEYQELNTKIREVVKSMREQARAQAAQDGLRSAYDVQLKAIEKFKSKLKEVREQFPDLYSEDGQLNMNAYNYDTKDAVSEVEALRQAYIDAEDSIQFYTDELENAVKATEEEGKAAEDAGKKTTSAGTEVKSVYDEVEEYAKHILNGEEEYTLEGFYEKFRETGDAADFLKNKLYDANKALEDNRSQIKQAQDEYEKYRSEWKKLIKVKEEDRDDQWQQSLNTANQKMQEASDKVTQLRTDQVDLKKAVTEATKAYQDAAWKAKTLEERLAEIAKTSSSVRSEMNSLAATFKELGEGRQMSLDALLSLTEKYPEYAAQILSATDNLNAQKDVIKLLYEEKKKALIESLKDAKDEIKLEQDKIKLQRDSVQAKLNQALANKKNASEIENLKKQLAGLNNEFDRGKDLIAAYGKAIAAVGKFSINDYGGNNNGNTNANNNYTPSQTSSSPATQEWTWGWMDEIGTGNTSAAARLSLVERVHQLGKINDKELKAEYEKILREEQLTADESYNIRQKLYSMTAQLRQKDLDLAKAAYEKLVKGQIETYQKASDNIKNDLDKKLKALDDESKKRQQKEEDEKRRKEIRDIEDEIFYNGRRMTQIEKDSLLRRKQDLLNEQAKADYERDLELKKAQLQEQANAGVSKNTQAIERLNKVLEDASYYLAKISGSQSSSQIVNNSTRTQNIQYIAGGFGMSYDQFIRQIY